jgi:hypothetical protein
MNLLSNTPLVNRVGIWRFTRSRCRFLVGDISRITSPPSKNTTAETNNRFFHSFYWNWRLTHVQLPSHPHTYIKKYHFLLSCQSDLTQIKSPRATSRILLCLLPSLFVFVVPIPSLDLFPTLAPSVCFCCWLVFLIYFRQSPSEKQNTKILPHECIANILHAFNFAPGKQTASRSIRDI